MDLQLIEVNNSNGLANFHIQHKYEFSYSLAQQAGKKRKEKSLSSAGLF